MLEKREKLEFGEHPYIALLGKVYDIPKRKHRKVLVRAGACLNYILQPNL